MEKINVGVIGATGMVGQNYIRLLDNHPWFNVTYVAASPKSAGKSYEEAVMGKWQMIVDPPEKVRKLIVGDANNVSEAVGKCKLVFSALEMEKEKIKELEVAYAKAGIPVFSNASANRHVDNVPMLIPEINSKHVDVIPYQKKAYGFDKGFIVVKPNCSLQSYMTPVYALIKAGYEVKRMIITTMQAVSGAGYPGVPSLDMIDNIVPFISGEEEKSEVEPQKIMGKLVDGKIVNDTSMKISAHCNRVPVIDGHTACVSLEFGTKKPSIEEIKKIWREFKSEPQELNLPFAPKHPIIYREESNRPQPRKDRDTDKGMAATVGRLRECKVFDIRFVCLSHNTVRGAAGGGILNAELLKAKGYL
ncbi:MAG TPA: aspartate-semialdehyde dehydrogenase [Methanofastidiosum sp.]|nr:aspartate-semialdehyde dehydrogenase [Methanofastidiosum sp.]HQM94885.1 aspartate-semialdehyde dehydrogenase [Methanofastidiosum sp.]HQQ49322.1 aspartate-semialdehyde dehydrogenase [Methanofastidiosum sp.]